MLLVELCPEHLGSATPFSRFSSTRMHGKNLGLLHPSPGVVELAPLYDVVPTMLWPQLKTDAAMHIGGCRRLPDVSLDDVVREASRWTLQPDLAVVGHEVGDGGLVGR